MLEFVKYNGLPYLVTPDGEFFAVRWDSEGFTVGSKVDLPINRDDVERFSELSIKAQCAENIDSIKGSAESTEDASEDLDSMTLKQLKAYAGANGIDIDGKTKKSEIVEIIKAVYAE